MDYKKEIKAIKLLHGRAKAIENAHSEIEGELLSIKKQLSMLGSDKTNSYQCCYSPIISSNASESPLSTTSINDIFIESEDNCLDNLNICDILSGDDVRETDGRIKAQVRDFNSRYNLDAWDYSIACACGIFASMLDILLVRAPLKPTASWHAEVDGFFNKGVQVAFNKLLPPELSEQLSKANPIGAPDSSTVSDLIGGPSKALNPMNHRLRSLAHDPVLGFIFGVWDMLNGTCTVVVDGKLLSIRSKKAPVEASVFQLLGRMMGHLLSDVNAPSSNGNRGMGLPAPFMGVLKMFEGLPVGNSSFGKQIEWMYVNGYDFRQFVTTSIPMAIMETLLRTFFTIKQMHVYGLSFGETLLSTMPGRINPRFRIILALAYGTSSSINAGKMYITQNILNTNYASWMGFAWNGFHALKWALFDRHLKLWDEIEQKEIDELEETVVRISTLEERARRLPSKET